MSIKITTMSVLLLLLVCVCDAAVPEEGGCPQAYFSIDAFGGEFQIERLSGHETFYLRQKLS